MPRLGIAKDFLTYYAKLQKPVQRAVDAAIGKFSEHTHAGLHLEKLNNAKDPRIRTIRINQSYRGVVLAPETGEVCPVARFTERAVFRNWVSGGGSFAAQDLAAQCCPVGSGQELDNVAFPDGYRVELIEQRRA